MEAMKKIVIDLPTDAHAAAELLWAKDLGHGKFELQSVPVWAYGLAFEDIIEASTADDGRLHFVRLDTPSGLLTVRAAGPHANPESFARLRALLAAASEVAERFSDTYSAFALRPEAYRSIESAIDDAERSGEITVEIANETS